MLDLPQRTVLNFGGPDVWLDDMLERDLNWGKAFDDLESYHAH